MQGFVAETRKRLALVQQGGGKEQMRGHGSHGKLPAWERVERLIDPGAPFLEFSALAAWDMYDGTAPRVGAVACSIREAILDPVETWAEIVEIEEPEVATAP
jgi:3-methylcrotonyl-CoA carboxylase beta subunit